MGASFLLHQIFLRPFGCLATPSWHWRAYNSKNVYISHFILFYLERYASPPENNLNQTERRHYASPAAGSLVSILNEIISSLARNARWDMLVRNGYVHQMCPSNRWLHFSTLLEGDLTEWGSWVWVWVETTHVVNAWWAASEGCNCRNETQPTWDSSERAEPPLIPLLSPQPPHKSYILLCPTHW